MYLLSPPAREPRTRAGARTVEALAHARILFLSLSAIASTSSRSNNSSACQLSIQLHPGDGHVTAESPHELKEEGTKAFNAGDFQRAVHMYPSHRPHSESRDAQGSGSRFEANAAVRERFISCFPIVPCALEGG